MKTSAEPVQNLKPSLLTVTTQAEQIATSLVANYWYYGCRMHKQQGSQVS